MVDETRTTTVQIDGNSVHDAGCADGIDVRASGHSERHGRGREQHARPAQAGRSKQSILGDRDADDGHRAPDRATRRGTPRPTSAPPPSRTSARPTPKACSPTARATRTSSSASTATRSRTGSATSRRTASRSRRAMAARRWTSRSRTAPATTSSATSSRPPTFEGRDAQLQDRPRARCALDLRGQPGIPPGRARRRRRLPARGRLRLGQHDGREISNSLFTDCAADGLGVVSNVVDGSGRSSTRLRRRNSRITSNKLSNLRIATPHRSTELAAGSSTATSAGPRARR